MMKKIIMLFIVFSLTNIMEGGDTIITSEGRNYIVYNPGETLTFIGHARYGTPCYGEPHYLYKWESNNTGIIGNTKEFTINATDPRIAPWGGLLPIHHNITLTVEDCMGAKATDYIELVVVHPLKAEILYPVNGTSFDCLINLTSNVSGGLPPYRVKWKSHKDGMIDEYLTERSGEVYSTVTTPPLLLPLSSGVHNLTLYVKDSLGLTAFDEIKDINIAWCCAINATCKWYWPAHKGKKVCIGNEEGYACDIYEVCHPRLWEKARKAVYCCKNNCSGGCHEYCKDAYNSGAVLGSTQDGLKKCAGLYLVYGFGPAAEFMEDYFWPERACDEDEGSLSTCCTEDLGTCRCSWHRYNKNVLALPCTGYVSHSSLGWRSDVAMNKNTCKASDLPAHVSILDEDEGGLHTGTCVDYSGALTTMLRIVGYKPDEVYSVVGPGHSYNLIKFPGAAKWNIVDTTGNYAEPYNPFGLPTTGYGAQYCLYDDQRYCPGCVGATCPGGGCVDTWPRCCRNDVSIFPCPSQMEVYGC